LSRTPENFFLDRGLASPKRDETEDGKRKRERERVRRTGVRAKGGGNITGSEVATSGGAQ